MFLGLAWLSCLFDVLVCQFIGCVPWVCGERRHTIMHTSSHGCPSQSVSIHVFVYCLLFPVWDLLLSLINIVMYKYSCILGNTNTCIYNAHVHVHVHCIWYMYVCCHMILLCVNKSYQLSVLANISSKKY